jgi:hypothetical protein
MKAGHGCGCGRDPDMSVYSIGGMSGKRGDHARERIRKTQRRVGNGGIIINL